MKEFPSTWKNRRRLRCVSPSRWTVPFFGSRTAYLRHFFSFPFCFSPLVHIHSNASPLSSGYLLNFNTAPFLSCFICLSPPLLLLLLLLLLLVLLFSVLFCSVSVRFFSFPFLSLFFFTFCCPFLSSNTRHDGINDLTLSSSVPAAPAATRWLGGFRRVCRNNAFNHVMIWLLHYRRLRSIDFEFAPIDFSLPVLLLLLLLLLLQLTSTTSK